MSMILFFMLGKALYMDTWYWVIFTIFCAIKIIDFVLDVAVKVYKKMNGEDD